MEKRHGIRGCSHALNDEGRVCFSFFFLFWSRALLSSWMESREEISIVVWRSGLADMQNMEGEFGEGESRLSLLTVLPE